MASEPLWTSNSSHMREGRVSVPEPLYYSLPTAAPSNQPQRPLCPADCTRVVKAAAEPKSTSYPAFVSI